MALDGVMGGERLVSKLRAGDSSNTWAEAEAIALLRTVDTAIEVEVEPKVVVAGGERWPDFRARRAGSSWVYCEVTRPNLSEIHARVHSILAKLTAHLDTMEGRFALEVFLRREPTDEEVQGLLARIPKFCSPQERHELDLPDDLGKLFLNHSAPGKVTLDDHGEEHQPRLSAARFVAPGGVTERHLVVRIPYEDRRAEEFLRAEARQLPTDAATAIVVAMANAPGGFKSWEPLLQRRFQPTIHTRVGGVVLYQSGQVATAMGEAIRTEARVLENPYARRPLPEWFVEAFRRYEENLGLAHGP
jgi:hypothetical protein